MKLGPNLILIIFLCCYALILIRWRNMPIDDINSQARSGVYGDAWSSRNVHSAAMWFTDMGFTATKGLPVLMYKGNFNREGTTVYTHYPPLPDILGGMYARLLNTKDARTLSLVPILLSVIFFFSLLLILRKITPDKQAANLSWLTAVTSCYFICWADDLHQHLYTELLKWIYVFVLYLYYAGKRKKWMIPALCGIYFIQSLLTFEPILLLAVVTIGFSVVFERKLFTYTNVILLLMPLLGVFSHLLQNYFYFGSWEGVINDMKQAFLHRTVGGGSNENELSRAVNFNDVMYYWGHELIFRMGRAFSLPGICILFFSALSMIHFYKYNCKHFELALVFLIAGVMWYLLMFQHAYIHTFTIKHLGLFVFFTTGTGVLLFVKLIQQAWQQKIYSFLLPAIAIVIYSVYGILYNLAYYVVLKFGFAYPLLGTDAQLW